MTFPVKMCLGKRKPHLHRNFVAFRELSEKEGENIRLVVFWKYLLKKIKQGRSYCLYNTGFGQLPGKCLRRCLF